MLLINDQKDRKLSADRGVSKNKLEMGTYRSHFEKVVSFNHGTILFFSDTMR